MVSNAILPVDFFRTRSGSEPVRDWLKQIEPADRRVIGYDLRRVQKGWPVGMPLCRNLGDGLWEIRSNLPSRRIARVLFVIRQDRVLLLHGFIKKSQATPAMELDLARKRARESNP
jgi:phage-related protein